jgi:hypothetical protein
MLWVWVWRGNFVAPTWLRVPVSLLPAGAVFVALKPGEASASVRVFAYGFLIPHLLGVAILSVVGRLEARRMTDEERRNRAARANEWMGFKRRAR